MNHNRKSKHDNNVIWLMQSAREMKNSYIQKILMFSDKPHTREELKKKNLNRIKEIYEKEVG